MGELVFIGLGLFDEKDMSLRAYEEAKEADYVYAEFYTSLMAGFSLENLERKLGKRVTVVPRRILEDENGEAILLKAEHAKVAFLVPGDPLIATTHIDLRIRAEKRGIETRVVHGASIISAAMGLSGLQNYKFGRSVTIPFSELGQVSETPYNVIGENKKRGLHTLCFLDIKTDKRMYLTINEALKMLLFMEEKRKQNVFTLESLVVGIARAGGKNPTVKADKANSLLSFDFGSPPHVLIVPSDKLHFMEAEALISLAGAPEWVKGMAR